MVRRRSSPILPSSPDESSVVQVGAGTVSLRVAGRPGREKPATKPGDRPSKYGKWRAMTLAGVYVLMVVHVVHWKINGTTLAPLELNEVAYTLELGIVTAGFLFMAVALVGTLVFGRFFCSWLCHILALQDLCAWLLGRVGIRPKPVRSRVLLLVPPIVFLYMFGWPQVQRHLEQRPPFELRVLTDEEGWASFLTNDFWRNLPDPWITALTFAVCGFLIVYVLGSRSFCQYACPYGALFAFVDRIAPGKIKLTGHCQQCGHCTAVCESHVRVHEEIARFGTVVDVNCMKDLDCVGSCPQGAITFGFARPSLLRSFSRTGRRRLRYDFSLAEDAVMVAVFLATVLIFRGLYHIVPFLLTLGLGGIFAYTAVLCLRMARRPDVRFNRFQLKRGGQVTGVGQVFASAALLLAIFAGHSAVVRYHEWRGGRAHAEARRRADPPAELVQAGLGHLSTCMQWGLFQPAEWYAQMSDLHMLADDPQRAAPCLRVVIERHPDDLSARLALAKVYWVTGRPDAASREATHLLEQTASGGVGPEPRDPYVHHHRVEAHQLLSEWFAQRGELDRSIEHLTEVVALLPDSAPAHANLGLVLAERGRPEEAVLHLERATELDPQLSQPRLVLQQIRAGRGPG